MPPHCRLWRRPFYVAGMAFLTMAASWPVARAAAGPGDESVTSPEPHRSRPVRTDSRASRLRFDVNLVLIPVTVTDSYERPIRGLQKSDFRLLEDATEQPITKFFSDDSPISAGLVLDASHSMLSKLDQSRRAITEFLKLTSPGDEFFLLAFNDRPKMMTRFTSNLDEIEDGLQFVQARGWTSLYDAIYLGISQMKHASHSRKILFVFSDGNDNDSRYTRRELTDMVKEADVRIFAISILDKSPSLEELCDESGGRSYRVRKLDELPDLAARISEELHSEYVLGFVPAATERDGKYRHISVQLTKTTKEQSLRASWRRGYYGPAQ